MNNEKSNDIHPMFPHIIKRMSPDDAMLLLTISKNNDFKKPLKIPMAHENLIHSLLTLESLGLVFTDYKEIHFCYIGRTYPHFLVYAEDSVQEIKISLTAIGLRFLHVCYEETDSLYNYEKYYIHKLLEI